MEQELRPLINVNPGCADCRVALIIYPPDNLSLQKITERLKIEPDTAGINGVAFKNKVGGGCITNNLTWVLSSGGKVKSTDMTDHLEWLLNLILPAKAVLKELQTRQGLKMSIHCLWLSLPGWGGGPRILPQHMAMISDLNLELSFNLYFDIDESSHNLKVVLPIN